MDILSSLHLLFLSLPPVLDKPPKRPEQCPIAVLLFLFLSARRQYGFVFDRFFASPHEWHSSWPVPWRLRSPPFASLEETKSVAFPQAILPAPLDLCVRLMQMDRKLRKHMTEAFFHNRKHNRAPKRLRVHSGDGERVVLLLPLWLVFCLQKNRTTSKDVTTFAALAHCSATNMSKIPRSRRWISVQKKKIPRAGFEPAIPRLCESGASPLSHRGLQPDFAPSRHHIRISLAGALPLSQLCNVGRSRRGSPSWQRCEVGKKLNGKMDSRKFECPVCLEQCWLAEARFCAKCKNPFSCLRCLETNSPTNCHLCRASLNLKASPVTFETQVPTTMVERPFRTGRRLDESCRWKSWPMIWMTSVSQARIIFAKEYAEIVRNETAKGRSVVPLKILWKLRRKLEKEDGGRRWREWYERVQREHPEAPRVPPEPLEPKTKKTREEKERHKRRLEEKQRNRERKRAKAQMSINNSSKSIGNS